jgi:hypothetical protein
MTGYFSKLIPVLCALFSASGLFAGSLDYLSNQSARYAMTFSRNAATDAADIVAYNPAGTALLPQGLSIDISNQTLIKPYEQEYSIAFDFAPYSGYNTSERRFNRMSPPGFSRIFSRFTVLVRPE